MNLWQSNRYIPFFGYRFYYKQFILYQIAKPLKLSCFRKWKHKKNLAKKKYGKTRNAQAKRAKVKSEKCFVCGQKFEEGEIITLEHIVPKSKLKDKKLYENSNNHALSHSKCNNLKADKIWFIP